MRPVSPSLRSSESTGQPEPGDHVATLNGVDLHYSVSGNGPLLFLIPPGWGVGSSYLRRGFTFLQDRFRLVFLDMRGSGLSGRPADAAKMSSHDMADDIEALREHLGLPSIWILGHSNAGAIALSYAERYRDRVEKMVLIDSQVFGFAAANDTQAFLQARAEHPQYKTAVQTALSGFSGKIDFAASDESLTAFVGQILPLYFQHPEKNLNAAQEQLSGRIASYAFRAQNAADQAAGVDQTVLLDQIRASVLIISGRHDWICPVAVAERLHEGIPNSRLVVFEESGHMPWLEEPATCAAELVQFLEV
jgi:pimeloyl-ACP methyl ester carboxylesterase